MVQGSPLGRLRPLIMNESVARIRNEKLEMRNGGAAHKIWKRRGVLNLAVFSYRNLIPSY